MESDRAILWTVAIAASLGLHVLLIVALLGFGAIAGGSEPEPLPKPAVAAESNVVAGRSQDDAVVSGEQQVATGSSEPRTAANTDSIASEQGAVDAPATSDEKYYVVKAGDNLSKIAKLDDSTLAELAELNGKSIKELSKLMIGQKIRVKNGIK